MKRIHVTLVPTLLAAVTIGLLGSPAGAQQAPGAKSPSGSTPTAAPPQQIKPIDTISPGAEPPARGFRLEPTMPYEQLGTREQEFYPGREIKSVHDPAFIAPFVTNVRTSPTSVSRLGFSGWTAPALPYDIPQETGGLAFGLTFTWGGPVLERKEPGPAGSGQR